MFVSVQLCWRRVIVSSDEPTTIVSPVSSHDSFTPIFSGSLCFRYSVDLTTAFGQSERDSRAVLSGKRRDQYDRSISEAVRAPRHRYSSPLLGHGEQKTKKVREASNLAAAPFPPPRFRPPAPVGYPLSLPHRVTRETASANRELSSRSDEWLRDLTVRLGGMSTEETGDSSRSAAAGNEVNVSKGHCYLFSGVLSKSSVYVGEGLSECSTGSLVVQGLLGSEAREEGSRALWTRSLYGVSWILFFIS